MHEVGNENNNRYRNMVMDAMRMSEGNASEFPNIEEEPNADAARFFDLLKDSDGHYRMTARTTVNYRP
jgi:hypothetical protein